MSNKWRKPRYWWVQSASDLLTFQMSLKNGKWYSIHYYEYHARQMYIKTTNSAQYNLPKHWTWV